MSEPMSTSPQPETPGSDPVPEVVVEDHAVIAAPAPASAVDSSVETTVAHAASAQRAADPVMVEPVGDTATQAAEPQYYKRFDRWQRIEHGLLVSSFTLLVFTGLPQKYSLTLWGSGLIWLFGGIELIRVIHRVAAIVLMLETIYHGAVVTYKTLVTRVQLTMMPGWQDVVDGIHAMGYNLRLAKTPPRMGRFTFGEKVEYWAVIWGTVIMVLTGFMLWNPIATTQFLPGQAIPTAKAAHGGEALLAFLSIISWHVYHVHIKSFNRSIFTGYIGRHEMVEEHPLELVAIQAGTDERPVDPVVLRRRQRIFYPLAALFSLLLLLGLYWFVTFEQTAITTLPR